MIVLITVIVPFAVRTAGERPWRAQSAIENPLVPPFTVDQEGGPTTGIRSWDLSACGGMSEGRTAAARRRVGPTVAR
jgi:hypothetical protein